MILPKLKQLYTHIEAYKGKRLAIFLLQVFLAFLLVGLVIGYISSKTLNKSEIDSNLPSINGQKPTQNSKITRQGRVEFSNSQNYPGLKISYVLNQPDGKILPLYATDQKLQIAEGLSVKVVGKLVKQPDTQLEYMIVDEVIINAAN